MKYVRSRDKFLTGISEYKEFDSYKKYDLIQEDGGPLHNAVEFGDSWVGRWIFNVIRVAKENFDKVRISGQISRLKRALNEILDNSVPNQLDGDDKNKFNKLKVFSFLDSLDAAVRKGHKVGIIKNLTDSTIENVTKNEDFDGKEELIKQLEDFRKFLEQFKDDEEGADDPDFKIEDDKDEKDEKDENEDESKKLFTIIESLKSLALIIDTYKRVKIENKPTQKEVYTYITVDGDTIEKISKDPKINKNNLTSGDIRTKNSKNLSKYPKDNQTLPAKIPLLMEGFLFEADKFGTGGGVDRQNIKTTSSKTGDKLKTGEDHLTQAFSKLKKDIEVLESEKEKGIGITSKFINDITASYKDPKNRETIKSLYVEINRYLVGDKKSTIQEKDNLFKENIQIIENVGKKAIVAEKIARFTKRALQFDGQNLYGGLGDLGKNLQKYVESMKKIMTYKLGESGKTKTDLKYKVGDTVSWTNKKGEKVVKNIEKIEDGRYMFTTSDGEGFSKKESDLKKESKVLRFDSFYRIIKEADDISGDKEVKNDTTEGMSNTNKLILEYWTKNVDIKQYVIEKTEYKKLIKDLEKKGDELKDSIIFDIDPVLDIVKAFNKAYKIHTTPVIPSGRTTGSVSSRIFLQYTSLGGGTPDSAGKSGGPYRNNAVFNKWEEAVLDVLGNIKYQKIFSPKTKLKRGDEMVEKAGANLRTFMTDLIDGDNLYKDGAQKKFLDQYFGYKSSSSKDTNDGGDKEIKENNKTATDVVDKTKKVEFVNKPIGYEQDADLVGTIFKIESGGKSYYFLIHEMVGEYYYVTYTSGYKFYHDAICKEGKYGFPKLSEVKGDSSSSPSDSYTSGDGQYQVKATRIKRNLFLKDKGTISLKSYESSYIRKKKEKDKPFKNNISETEKIDDLDKINATKVFILSYKEGKDDKEPKFVKVTKFDSLKDKGIFPSIKSTKDIDKVEFKPI